MDFFFLLQRKQFNNAQHREKKKMIGRITIAINKISAKFLYETHPFYPSFLTLVPSENRKMHKQDSRIQCLLAALPCSMEDIYFCYFDFYCSAELNIHNFV